MNLYYTLTCVILPATMMAACSGSGSKKPIDTTSHSTDTVMLKRVDLNEKASIISLAEKIETISQASINTQEIELFPLTQTADTKEITKPIKRIYQFGFDNHEMTPTAQVSLQEHADFLLAHPDSSLDVNGHSDTQGNKIYNQFLSSERAKKVARFLIEYGVPEEQIKTYGLGDSQPLNDVNSFKENRRVELQYNDSRVATN